MVYESLIAIVEQGKVKMAESWFEEVKRTEYMKAYRSLSDVQLLERGKVLFNNLHIWLQKGADDKYIREYFEQVGKDRAREGFPLSEVNYALFLEKKVLWSFIAYKDEIQGPVNPADAVEFMSVLSSYFDMGEFNIIRGYMGELITLLLNSGKFSSSEMHNFLNGALEKENEKTTPSDLHIDTLDINLLKNRSG